MTRKNDRETTSKINQNFNFMNNVNNHFVFVVFNSITGKTNDVVYLAK